MGQRARARTPARRILRAPRVFNVQMKVGLVGVGQAPSPRKARAHVQEGPRLWQRGHGGAQCCLKLRVKDCVVLEDHAELNVARHAGAALERVQHIGVRVHLFGVGRLSSDNGCGHVERGQLLRDRDHAKLQVFAGIIEHQDREAHRAREQRRAPARQTNG
jgi:hypothetical protein